MVSPTTVPTFEWINHAAFLLCNGTTALACDPWLSGTAFHRGWRQISDSAFSADDFSRVSHIWFSHQHPDHFAPNDLRRIPPEARARITILYHRTIDKKVVRFCQSLGFKEQIELSDGDWFSLDAETSVKCGVWFDRDSWLAIKTRAGTILNLNDCVVDSRALARKIFRKTGPVRLLLTQFSYAEYQGGPDEKQQRIDSARNKLDRITAQVAVFTPEYVIPFASFVYWCHPENFHMNVEMNRVGNVASFIQQHLARKPVVLYPGERWSVGETRDWRESADRYDRDLTVKLAFGPTETPESVSLETLERAAERFLMRLHKNNPLLFLSHATSTSIRLHDLDVSLELSRERLRRVPSGEDADIEMHSESLLFCLKAPWGSNALAVNGRFTSPSGKYGRFFDFFKPADWADHGYTMRVSMLPAIGQAGLVRARAALARRSERRGGTPVLTAASDACSHV